MTDTRAHMLGRDCGRARVARGFTLVEMVIVIAIVALVSGIAVTAVDSMSRAALRKTSGIVASAMKAAYDSAALTGKTYRLAFVIGDPKKSEPSVIKVEASPELLVYDPETSTLTRALAGSKSGAIDWESFATGNEAEGATGFSAIDGPAADALDKVLGTSGREGAHANSKDKDDEEEEANDTGFQEAAKKIEVDEDVRVLSVWTEGMDKPADAGEVYIYFFPNGYTQDAIVHLQDGDRRVLSIRLAPLTGKPTIKEGYVEAPE